MNRITFDNGLMTFYAGNDNPAIQLEPDKVIINEDADSTIDFWVRSGAVSGPALYVDGGNGYVGVNCNTPTEQLTVCGSQTISGSLSANALISQGSLRLTNLPTSDPLIAGGIYYCPTDKILRISCVT
jgi:hypothetical protein